MDEEFVLGGLRFRWDRAKAYGNLRKHGVTFEQAAQVFFDPFVRSRDASVDGEPRDGVIGVDFEFRILFIVHMEIAFDHVRIVSARIADAAERRLYED